VFTHDPRGSGGAGLSAGTAVPAAASRTPRDRSEFPPAETDPAAPFGGKSAAESRSQWVVDFGPTSSAPASPKDNATALKQTESAPLPPSTSASVSSSKEKRPSTEELFSKPFRDEESSPGENLKFDFNDDHPRPEMSAGAADEIAGDEIANDRLGGDWQVGETDFEAPVRAAPREAPATASKAPGEAPAIASATPEKPPLQFQAPSPEPPRQFGAPSLEPARPLFPPEAKARLAAKAKPPVPATSAPRAPAVAPKPSMPKNAYDDEDFVDEDTAPIYNRSVATHSARFFVGLFVLIALGYATMAVLIRSAPATAAEMLSHLPKIGDRFIPPITPARLVAMRDVHSDYLKTKDGHTALVVTGIAENVGDQPLHAVQIAASLQDTGQRTLASRAAYCGNNLSAPMMAQMTPHEIEFFQKLDPPKTYALEPAATSPFVIVFIDPPSGISRFDLSVASAVASASPPTASGG